MRPNKENGPNPGIPPRRGLKQTPTKQTLTRCIWCGMPIIATITPKGQQDGLEVDSRNPHRCRFPATKRATRGRPVREEVEREYQRVMGDFGLFTEERDE